MNKQLTLLLFLILSSQLYAQNYYLDTLPRFRVQNLVSLHGRAANPAIGVYYSRNLWSGLGYRNYEEISIGVNYGKYILKHYSFSNTSVPYIDFDIRAQHNIRLKLKRLLYFTLHLGYSPKIPLKTLPIPTYDDFVNCGYVAIGLQGQLKNVSIGFYAGALAREAKQDLYYEIHTYAQFLPQVKMKVGISFGERQE